MDFKGERVKGRKDEKMAAPINLSTRYLLIVKQKVEFSQIRRGR